MSELNGLKTRVETTAERLAAAQKDRRQQNHSLLEILGRLEQKFAAQEQELAFYRERIGPLEAANAQLSHLMQRLLDLVDAGLDGADDPQDPVAQAAAMAAAMLERDLVPVPGTEPLYEDVDAATLAAEEAAEAVFEDAEEAALAHEAVAEAEEGLADEKLPEIVRTAIMAAAEPETVDSLAAALGQEISNDDPLQPSAADIRALLERVEAAAARMEGENERAAYPEPSIPSPSSARQVAGAAA